MCNPYHNSKTGLLNVNFRYIDKDINEIGLEIIFYNKKK